MTTKLDLAKSAVKIVTGLGAGSIITQVVKNNTTVTSTVQAVSIPTRPTLRPRSIQRRFGGSRTSPTPRSSNRSKIKDQIHGL